LIPFVITTELLEDVKSTGSSDVSHQSMHVSFNSIDMLYLVSAMFIFKDVDSSTGIFPTKFTALKIPEKQGWSWQVSSF